MSEDIDEGNYPYTYALRHAAVHDTGGQQVEPPIVAAQLFDSGSQLVYGGWGIPGTAYEGYDWEGGDQGPSEGQATLVLEEEWAAVGELLGKLAQDDAVPPPFEVRFAGTSYKVLRKIPPVDGLTGIFFGKPKEGGVLMASTGGWGLIALWREELDSDDGSDQPQYLKQTKESCFTFACRVFDQLS
ncbi:hypothetical protein ABT160_38330 [Streptomyces sp. NPDC001941]|uniref:hypothetical protein n=1 Tax=Streptomyces sp. NPDC001941 TaxID=3154659 RepID=UPI003322DE35